MLRCSLCPKKASAYNLSTAEHKPPLARAYQVPRSSAFLIHVIHVIHEYRRTELGSRPTPRLPRRGLHSRTRLLQRLLVLRQIWPTRYHFNLLILRAMSVTLVLSRITSFLILSTREKPSIARSIVRCATFDLWASPTVSDHGSASYVITGRTQCSKTSVFKHLESPT